MFARWLPGWARGRGRNVRPAAAVYLSARAALLVRGARAGGRVAIEACGERLDREADTEAVLQTLCRQLDVADAEANLVLAPDMYTLTLVERPPVPDEEIREAVRWRIQDHLDYPVDQAAIDVFALPESASRDRAMVFVVAMQRDALARTVQRVHGAGVRIGSVDVTELALRNLSAALFPEPDTSVGLLRLTAASGIINITRGDTLFLSRRISGIPAELSERAWQGFDDRLLLQVQRSIDYYESAMSQPPCRALIVAAAEGWHEQVCRHLDEMLPVAVRTPAEQMHALFDLTLHGPAGQAPQAFDWRAPSVSQRDALGAALPAIGGLLRIVGDATGDVLEAVA